MVVEKKTCILKQELLFIFLNIVVYLFYFTYTNSYEMQKKKEKKKEVISKLLNCRLIDHSTMIHTASVQ